MQKVYPQPSKKFKNVVLKGMKSLQLRPLYIAIKPKTAGSMVYYDDLTMNNLFVVQKVFVRDSRGLMVDRHNNPITSSVLKPSSIFETLMVGAFRYHNQEHCIRPQSDPDFTLDTEGSLDDFIHYMHSLYVNRRNETKNLRNHYSIYPSLLCDYTPDHIWFDLSKRVSANVRPTIFEQIVRVRSVPKKTYNWVREKGTLMLLENYPEWSPIARLANPLQEFLINAKTR